MTTGPQRKATGRRRQRIALPVLTMVASLVWAVAAAQPIAAHPATVLAPTNYETRIIAVIPAVFGLTMRVVDHGDQLALTNTTTHDIVVLGYAGEPYLRVGPRGTFTNQRSPATYLNRARLASIQMPLQANPKAAPVWRRVSGNQTVAWHDHRAHWMGTSDPPEVQAAPWQLHVINARWTVELRDGTRRIMVTGDLRWVPTPPSTSSPNPTPWPWLIGAAGLLSIMAAARRGWRPVTPRPR